MRFTLSHSAHRSRILPRQRWRRDLRIRSLSLCSAIRPRWRDLHAATIAESRDDQIYAAPGRTGDLWLAIIRRTLSSAWLLRGRGQRNLFRSSFRRRVRSRPSALAKQPPTTRFRPSIWPGPSTISRASFVQPTASEHLDAHRSDDQHRVGTRPALSSEAIPRIYGRVYVGTHGRGIVYGDPVGALNAPAPEIDPEPRQPLRLWVAVRVFRSFSSVGTLRRLPRHSTVYLVPLRALKDDLELDILARVVNAADDTPRCHALNIATTTPLRIPTGSSIRAKPNIIE